MAYSVQSVARTYTGSQKPDTPSPDSSPMSASRMFDDTTSIATTISPISSQGTCSPSPLSSSSIPPSPSGSRVSLVIFTAIKENVSCSPDTPKETKSPRTAHSLAVSSYPTSPLGAADNFGVTHISPPSTPIEPESPRLPHSLAIYSHRNAPIEEVRDPLRPSQCDKNLSLAELKSDILQRTAEEVANDIEWHPQLKGAQGKIESALKKCNNQFHLHITDLFQIAEKALEIRQKSFPHKIDR